MKIKTLAKRVRILGEQLDFKGQGQLFLKETGSDISIREAVPQKSPMWSKDGKHGIHYSVTISKDPSKSYTFDFWGSIADAEKKRHGEFVRRPTAYDILCCLKDGDGIDNYGDFCATYGYDEDSRNAYRTYEAVMEQKENMQRIFTREELDALSEII